MSPLKPWTDIEDKLGSLHPEDQAMVRRVYWEEFIKQQAPAMEAFGLTERAFEPMRRRVLGEPKALASTAEALGEFALAGQRPGFLQLLGLGVSAPVGRTISAATGPGLIQRGLARLTPTSEPVRRAGSPPAASPLFGPLRRRAKATPTARLALPTTAHRLALPPAGPTEGRMFVGGPYRAPSGRYIKPEVAEVPTSVVAEGAARYPAPVGAQIAADPKAAAQALMDIIKSEGGKRPTAKAKMAGRMLLGDDPLGGQLGKKAQTRLDALRREVLRRMREGPARAAEAEAKSAEASAKATSEAIGRLLNQ